MIDISSWLCALQFLSVTLPVMEIKPRVFYQMVKNLGPPRPLRRIEGVFYWPSSLRKRKQLNIKSVKVLVSSILYYKTNSYIFGLQLYAFFFFIFILENVSLTSTLSTKGWKFRLLGRVTLSLLVLMNYVYGNQNSTFRKKNTLQL